MKRACIIIADCETLQVRQFDSGAFNGPWYAHPSPQLLADLRALTDWNTTDQDWLAPAARVRDLLPKEES